MRLNVGSYVCLFVCVIFCAHKLLCALIYSPELEFAPKLVGELVCTKRYSQNLCVLVCAPELEYAPGLVGEIVCATK